MVRRSVDEVDRVDLKKERLPFHIKSVADFGGVWKNYRRHIEDFAKRTGVDVTIYRLPSSSGGGGSATQQQKSRRKKEDVGKLKKNTITTRRKDARGR